jgi:hypothetical protein
MHMMDTGRSDMMAAWRATGGAIEAMEQSGDRAMADDGLAASMRTGGGYGCYADDGLQAMTPTDFNVCYVDDGLAASMRTGGYGCYADDGLQASAGSFRPPWCVEDDGLQASMYSIGGGAANCPHADDGLGASMYSIGGGAANCPHADDGLGAMAYSRGTGCFGFADDGLAASVGTFRPPYCIAD